MTAIAALSINDGKATPVAHSFSPQNIKDGVARWVDRSAGIAIGYPALSFSLREPSKASKNYRITAKVVLPVLEQTSPSTATGIQPAPTVAYTLLATTEIVLPERSVLADRKDLAAYLRNFLANPTVITAALENFEAVYGA
jgi:hypothetical protein